ncbi:hypothetical protein [Vibrio mangrovi]|uniref:Uncharacterized protein n=1 Tax=Vibrio mangrovi TaxID=474394 RepID=A0A1Y6IY24_9VIBR|nr:hypothetical protein [Vibrio mangrovi]MDW6002546.1 hypothetical protein [Vibrio mangrovi]SMS01921.1 hypothetical protein VIM7927_03232 [Vibrio mangrovi]
MTSEKVRGKIWGLCSSCGPTEIVSRLKNVHLLGPAGMVMGIVVMTCKQCQQVVNVPDESIECVREVYGQLTTQDISS